jgi:YidC/Oxa1 family membrane protein insertase
MGWGILAISMGIKLVFTPLMFSAQLNACRMKLIEPETKNF